MARQDIAIYLQNVVGCFEFSRRHPCFWYNQTFESSCIYIENEKQVYNKMNIGKW